VNVGGQELSGSPAWSADTSSSASQYLVDTTDLKFSNFGDSVTQKSSEVPDSTPLDLYKSARYADTENTQVTDMNWEFSENIQDGQTYEVRLYFAEPYFGGDGPAQEGAREFHVDIDGDRKLENYDIYADVGFGTGTVKEFTITSDGTIDIDLVDGAANNPIINGIEIVETDSSGSGST
jgi:hypothetical protein